MYSFDGRSHVHVGAAAGCIAFGTNGCLAQSDGVLRWLLLQESWIIILAIAWTYLAEMIFHTILIYNRRFNYCAGESSHLVMDQWHQGTLIVDQTTI